MKKIIEISSELVGKTIVSADDSGSNMDAMVFEFDDGTVAVIDVRNNGYDISLSAGNDLSDGDKLAIGAMTQDEYDDIEKAKNDSYAELKKERDLILLRKLKAQYEEG